MIHRTHLMCRNNDNNNKHQQRQQKLSPLANYTEPNWKLCMQKAFGWKVRWTCETKWVCHYFRASFIISSFRLALCDVCWWVMPMQFLLRWRHDSFHVMHVLINYYECFSASFIRIHMFMCVTRIPRRCIICPSWCGTVHCASIQLFMSFLVVQLPLIW